VNGELVEALNSATDYFVRFVTHGSRRSISKIRTKSTQQLKNVGEASTERRGMKKVSVKLAEKDWMDLIQFLRGDLANMDPADEVTFKNGRICVEIVKSWRFKR